MNPSEVSLKDGELFQGWLLGLGVVEQDAKRLVLRTTNASSKLVELRQAEPLRILDDHHVSIRNVDSDLDDCGSDQCGKASDAKLGDHLFLFGRGHPAVKKPDRIRRQERPPFLKLGRRRLHRKLLGFFDQWINDVGLASSGDLLSYEVDDLGQFRCLPHNGDDAPAIGGLFPKDGNIQIAVDRLREGARDRRRRHDEDIRRIAAGDQTRSLQHAELVLLIDDNQPKIVEFARFIQERMCADNELGSIRVPPSGSCRSGTLETAPEDGGASRSCAQPGNQTQG